MNTALDDHEAAQLACPTCRKRFTPTRSDQAYCSTRCNALGVKLEQRRARRIYRAIYHMRLEHDTFGPNWRFITREVAAWIREDREMQRLPPPKHNHDADRGHERAPQAVKL